VAFCTGEEKGMQLHMPNLCLFSLPFRQEQLTSSIMISYSNTTDTERWQQGAPIPRVKIHQPKSANTITARARNDRDKQIQPLLDTLEQR